MVDTKKIRENLGDRDTIGISRANMLSLLECYEKRNKLRLADDEHTNDDDNELTEEK